MTTTIKEDCIAMAASALADKGFTHISATDQIENIFAYAATSADFATVIKSDNPKIIAELKAQIKYICSLGLDAAKGRKLVYVKTRRFNDRPHKDAPNNWIVLPDITESYHALIHILVRSEALKIVTVQHTFENYLIEYTGNVSDVPIVKSWATKPADRGQYTGLFVTLYFPDGEIQTSYHHSADIQKTHRKFAEGQETWNDHELSMTAKSALMDAIRYIPVFDEEIASVVEHYDQSQDYDKQDPISDNQYDLLIDAIDDSGIDIVGLCKKFGVSALDELPEVKYKQCADTIKAYIENNKNEER